MQLQTLATILNIEGEALITNPILWKIDNRGNQRIPKIMKYTMRKGGGI